MSVNEIGAEYRSKSMDSTTSPLHRPLADVNPITGPAVDLYEDDYNDPVYQAKARILNRAIQDIGMGRYQVSSHPSQCLLSINGTGSGISSWSPALDGLREFYYVPAYMVSDAQICVLFTSDSVWPVGLLLSIILS